MLKKIRLFYWKKRDQGKGKQVFMKMGFIALSFVTLILFLIVHTLSGQEYDAISNVVSGSAVSGALVSGSAVTGEAVQEVLEEEYDTEEPFEEAAASFHINTEGLSSFLGFMSDECYEQMVSWLTKECETKGADSAKKLDYQKTDGYRVTSYVLVSDGSVCCVSYNLKANQVDMECTSLSEKDVQIMKKAAEEKEKKALAKERKAQKKKIAKSKKKKKSKTKKEVG